MDTRPSTTAAEPAQRQAQAQQYAGTVKTQVAALYTHDTQVGSDLTSATAGEGKIVATDFKADGGPVCDDPDYNDKFFRKFMGPSSRSTYFAMTSTSRFTGSPA